MFGVAQVTVPNTFTPGNPIKSADVNANFKALESAVNKISSVGNPSSVITATIDCAKSASKTPIMDFLRTLTPQDQFSITVSGKCDDSLTLIGYGEILGRDGATVGRLTLGRGAIITGLTVSGYTDSAGKWQGGLSVGSNTRFQSHLYDVVIDCPRAASEYVCNTGLAISSDAYLSGVIIKGGWSRGMTVAYGATVKLRGTVPTTVPIFGVSFKLDASRFSDPSRFNEDIGVGFGSSLVDLSVIASSSETIEVLNIDEGSSVFLSKPIKKVSIGTGAFLRSLSELSDSAITCSPTGNGAIVSRPGTSRVYKC